MKRTDTHFCHAGTMKVGKGTAGHDAPNDQRRHCSVARQRKSSHSYSRTAVLYTDDLRKFSQEADDVHPVIVPILEMRKLRLIGDPSLDSHPSQLTLKPKQ